MDGDDLGPPAQKQMRKMKKEDRLEKIENLLAVLLAQSHNINTTSNPTDDTHEAPSNNDMASPGTSAQSSTPRVATAPAPTPTPSTSRAPVPAVIPSLFPASTPKKVEVRPIALPKFDGKINVYVRKWLCQLESMAKHYNWEEATLVDSMKKSLEGDALQWFNSQPGKDCSWPVWKMRFSNEYANGEMLAELQDFVCLYKRENEGLLEFYNTKKKLGEKYGLRENIICNVIINRLDNPALKVKMLNKHYTNIHALHEGLKTYQRNNIVQQ